MSVYFISSTRYRVLGVQIIGGVVAGYPVAGRGRGVQELIIIINLLVYHPGSSTVL